MDLGMSTGTILVAIAILAVVVAYLARPFRRRPSDVERRIEGWVTVVRAERRRQATEAKSQAGEGAHPGHFCPQCSRTVDAGDRFCRACGAPLGKVRADEG